MKAQIAAVSLGLALLGAIAYGAWLGLRLTFDFFTSLDEGALNLTAIACIVALLAAWTIARGGLGPSERRAKEMALREEKTATYQLFVDFWENLLRRGRTHSDQLPVDLAGKLHVLERYLALYGGAAVIRAHTSLRELERDKGTQHPDVRARLCEALVAIRKDLGADVPFNATGELEQLLLPMTPVVERAAADSRDARSRTVLAPGA
jgi:hypothetical protein